MVILYSIRVGASATVVVSWNAGRGPILRLRVEPTPLRDVSPSRTRRTFAPSTGPRFSCSDSFAKTVAGSDAKVWTTWTRWGVAMVGESRVARVTTHGALG